MRRTFTLSILAPFILSGSYVTVLNPVSGQAERSVMSESAGVAEGQKGHQQVLQEYGVVKDAGLQAYVNELGQRLADSRTETICSGISRCWTARDQRLCLTRRLRLRHARHHGLYGR